MRKLFAIAAPHAAALAFIDTNSGAKLYICTTPQATDLTQSAFAALTWVQIKGVGHVGETGVSSNFLKYNTWDSAFVQKAKGTSDAGDPEIELARDENDAGQTALRAAALTRYNYAFKIERADLPNSNVGSKPTICYNRGLVAGPRTPNGRNEDFDVETFMLALQQAQIIVPPVVA